MKQYQKQTHEAHKTFVQEESEKFAKLIESKIEQIPSIIHSNTTKYLNTKDKRYKCEYSTKFEFTYTESEIPKLTPKQLNEVFAPFTERGFIVSLANTYLHILQIIIVQIPKS